LVAVLGNSKESGASVANSRDVWQGSNNTVVVVVECVSVVISSAVEDSSVGRSDNTVLAGWCWYMQRTPLVSSISWIVVSFMVQKEGKRNWERARRNCRKSKAGDTVLYSTIILLSRSSEQCCLPVVRLRCPSCVSCILLVVFRRSLLARVYLRVLVFQSHSLLMITNLIPTGNTIFATTEL